MALVEKLFFQGSLLTSVHKVYEVAESTRGWLKCLDVCNSSATSQMATVYLVPRNQTVGPDFEFIPGVSILPNEMFQWTGLHILNPGDSISVVGSAAGLTIHINGAETI